MIQNVSTPGKRPNFGAMVDSVTESGVRNLVPAKVKTKSNFLELYKKAAQSAAVPLKRCESAAAAVEYGAVTPDELRKDSPAPTSKSDLQDLQDEIEQEAEIMGLASPTDTVSIADDDIPWDDPKNVPFPLSAEPQKSDESSIPVVPPAPKRPPSFGNRTNDGSKMVPSIASTITVLITEDPPWTDQNRPAGSKFSEDEWMQARCGDKFHVIEMASGQDCSLVQFPARPKPKLSKRVVNGKVTMVDVTEYDQDLRPHDQFGLLVGEAFDGCMLLSPGVIPTHPGRIGIGGVVVNNPIGDGTTPFKYRIIFPEAPISPWAVGSVLTMTLNDPKGKEVESSAALGSVHERQRN